MAKRSKKPSVRTPGKALPQDFYVVRKYVPVPGSKNVLTPETGTEVLTTNSAKVVKSCLAGSGSTMVCWRLGDRQAIAVKLNGVVKTHGSFTF